MLTKSAKAPLAQPVIRFCYKRSKTAFNWLSSPQGRSSRFQNKSIVDLVANCSDFVDLCALFGYNAEEHIVQTGDGYLLGLHRLSLRKGEEDNLRVNTGGCSIRKPVVYLHHGLLMNSEVWVCMTEEHRCLPFTLVESGYDVWVNMIVQSVKTQEANKRYSWVTTEVTNTPRNRVAFLRHPINFGTFQWTSSHFMTYQTASIMFSQLPTNDLCPILVFHKELLRPLRHYPHIQCSMTKLTCLSRWLLPCRLQASTMVS